VNRALEALRAERPTRRAVIPFLGLLALACAVTHPAPEADAPETGRERVQRALVPSMSRGGIPVFGTLVTAISSLPFLGGLAKDDDLFTEEIRVELSDGTTVGGLFYDHRRHTRRPEPLVMMSFGLLQDRWGTEVAKIRQLYQDPDRFVQSDVLVLDHPTSGPFFAENGQLSPGSYDDGRMWLEVAQFMREKLEPPSIHAFGVSMSGQTVLHALAEDARRGLGLFTSGLALSIAPDFRRNPGAEFASLAPPEGGENPWRSLAPVGPWTPQRQLKQETLSTLVQKRFLPSYRRAGGTNTDWELPRSEMPGFFWRAFEERLAHLRRHRSDDWNERYRLDDVER
jgi:hypothetical protein